MLELSYLQDFAGIHSIFPFVHADGYQMMLRLVS